ncbi:TPA: AAA family ATPase [Bacillus cereus]|nr:AAA family ATPase [Bacillus cereus]HDR4610417.1 AAA family ATPase [Bacillus cereus]HDR4627918.1 AAA family ATPase [Bacillus cereus]HDR4662513.1 AAA family ATPase [Bacillus cereus]HDR4929617.1 AAA family ATPase [Bacillus cereus]
MKMHPQLLFVYTEKLRDCFKNQSFSFTNDFDIYFDNNQLIIKEKNNPYENLWGNKINNINLVVGKNGSGKSTLFELIGSTKQERMGLLRKKPGEFFSYITLYHLEDNKFILEGINFNIIKNIKNIPKGTSPEYSIIISYDSKNNIAYFEDYIQFATDPQKKHRVNEIAHIHYYSNELNYNWMTKKGYSEEDYHVGINRRYLNKPFIHSIYKFLSKESDAKQSLGLSDTKNVSININPYQITYLDIYQEKIFNLYGDHSFTILKKSVQNSILNKYNETKLSYSHKEIFILQYLELFALGIIEYTYKNLKETADKKIYIEELSLLTPTSRFSEGFNHRKDYLENLIDISNKFINASVPFSEEFNYPKNKALQFLESAEENYYTNNTTIKVPLNEGFDSKKYELLYFLESENASFMSTIVDLKLDNMSYGETLFINVFSNIYTSIDIIKANKRFNTIILILDEPDLSFHPEWSRKFIFYLWQIINEINILREFKFQIIISTHSPFMISDIPKEHITCIDIVKENNSFQRIVEKGTFGLMSNFYDIIHSEFFMESPIGEFANMIFKNILKDINNLETLERDQCIKKVDNIKSLINSIDDVVIRKKLLQHLHEKNIEREDYNYD